MTAQEFIEQTGYELELVQTEDKLNEYKIVTDDSLYSIFSKIEDVRAKEDFRVEIHYNDVCVYF